jgi:cysteine desulfurase
MGTYLDFNASTPVAPEVAARMAAALHEPFGNPSSDHWAGTAARKALETARAQIAALLGCDDGEVIFTSGGSEANNHAIKGAYFTTRVKHPHIITTQVEHPAVIGPCRFLERLGAKVTYVSVDGFGRVDPDDVRRALTPDTILISVMHANNEVGTIQPIADIGRIARDHGVLLHTDAAQSVGKIPTKVRELGVDLLSLVGHKFYGPKGVGALYVRAGVQLEPLIHGGGHESGRRAGTENVLLDVGLGAACELAESWIHTYTIRELRDLFWHRLNEEFHNVALNGHPIERLPNTLNVSFPGRIGAEVLGGLKHVAASTGSACHSGVVELSPVLKAMRVPPEVGMGAIRFSLGRTTTAQEIETVIQSLKAVLA